MRTKCYEYRHVVGLEETDLVGSVYKVNYLRWQGRCREMFLLEHAPGVLDELRGDLQLRTVDADCAHLADVAALDQISIRMRVEELAPAQIDFTFDYVRLRDGAEELVARGRQRVDCLRGTDRAATPARIPQQLRAALEAYKIVLATYPAATGTGGRA